MKLIRDLNFLTFWLLLGNQCFGSNTHVNSICYKNNLHSGHKHDSGHLLRPKKSWLILRKFVWFGMIFVCFAKIDFWDLFGTQILSLNPLVQSENIHNEKYRSFQKFRKVPINQSFCQLSCPHISFYNFEFNLLSWNDV